MMALTRFFLQLLIRSKITTDEAFNGPEAAVDKPIIYVLKTESPSDVFALQQACQKLSLPDPCTNLDTESGFRCDRMVYLDKPQGLFKHRSKTAYHDQFALLLAAHKKNPKLDIQLIPVTLFWGRAPGYEGQKPWFSILTASSPNWLKKTVTLILRGRDNLIRFSAPISLRQLHQNKGADPQLALKLEKIARVHFSRQQLAATGPKLPKRNNMQAELMRSREIREAIRLHAEKNGQTTRKSETQAQQYLDEVASDFSYPLIRVGDTVLNWIWNKLYKGINVNNIERVRQLAIQGHEIIYMPCHRSHMDYLLLSSILYQQGMTPPHIAAGVNLNFFPAGPIFRRGGAFFIRRTFKGNPLYASIFKSYLSCLIEKRYAIEFFTEGGRSRSGRLLPPKTGMLSMTIEAMCTLPSRPVTIVPICLGYDHVMEVKTYVKEMQGATKQKESFWQVLSITKKLQNFGHGFVNFGQPVTLNDYLDQAEPNWRTLFKQETSKEINVLVKDLSNLVMTRVNQAAAVNPLPMCALILLHAPDQSLTSAQCCSQLTLYTSLLQKAPYSSEVSFVELPVNEQVQHAAAMNKFSIDKNEQLTSFYLTQEQATELSFYRNNVIHLLALPSLLVRMIAFEQEGITQACLLQKVKLIYPLLQAELFLPWASSVEVEEYSQQVLLSLEQLGQIEQISEVILLKQEAVASMKMLADIISPILQRLYAVRYTTSATDDKDTVDIKALSLFIAHLGRLQKVVAPEYSDPIVIKQASISWQRLPQQTLPATEEILRQLVGETFIKLLDKQSLNAQNQRAAS
ncbi:glycerol-3-phosphate 1-O-acyltransferase PlsB [Motilimonas pumila]|uniref:Glycerol-3-phosphate acyltransferase n=1 Tax=Motilimonas pumila TaxID=2303987 RepID=A0A418YIX3_9GAMM|nr:glycerol-3-phosphate 1-O-acyltransferase PlsB [Motilimonas pumila]RJG50567.1 glycerol-3-phosphate 1-O-acyltransferase [Motilimonas pumila]